MTPELRASRGTKRRCQNETCGLPFYDLNRAAIVCPNCASAFVPPPPEAKPEYRGRHQRTFTRVPATMAAEPEAAAPADEEIADQPLVEATEGDAILEVEEEDADETLPVTVEDEPASEE